MMRLKSLKKVLVLVKVLKNMHVGHLIFASKVAPESASNVIDAIGDMMQDLDAPRKIEHAYKS